MESKIGFEKFQFIMATILKLQGQIANSDYDIPFTGHHLQNRESALNWSPIGRNARQGDRQQFKAMDKIYGIRKVYLHKFREILRHNGIDDVVIKLGGDTSFDIYPA